MQNVILIAGYTRSIYLEIIREYFSNKDILLACAYTREPKTEKKVAYLEEFDLLFNLNQPADIDKLQHITERVELVTCTQERDMPTYIKTLELCGKITKEQAKLYTIAIDKSAFKTQISKQHPHLVPKMHIIDDALLTKLDTLSYPQVIKPSGLAGSILINIVNSPEEFRKHYEEFSANMQQIGNESYGKSIDIITEEYIEGPQYSVNVYIDKDQRITSCPISRIVTPQEMGEDDSYSALQYSTNELTADSFEALKRSVQTVVEYFDIRDTSAHFDSVLHPTGWKFFEIGLRIGGKRQELYQLSHGMNHFKNDILNRQNKEVVIPNQKATACIVQKAATEFGNLQSISYTRTITTEKPPMIKEDKMAKIGSDVMPLKKGGGTIARHFIWGENENEVIEAGKTLFNSIKFDTT
ncbi:ATP-grasp domain-containing protein [Candidatus Pacebacteria bacterium]|nr:ATP-grasp domain-containing protein [Candidatus Paceibacterota bacterium]